MAGECRADKRAPEQQRDQGRRTNCAGRHDLRDAELGGQRSPLGPANFMVFRPVESCSASITEGARSDGFTFDPSKPVRAEFVEPSRCAPTSLH